MTFYLTSWRVVFGKAAAFEAPRRAKVIAAVSLGAWLAVIICGRMLTFFRPIPCNELPVQQVELLLTCAP
jgi:hypothetical protein